MMQLGLRACAALLIFGGIPPRHDMGGATRGNDVYLVGGIDVSQVPSADLLHASISAGTLGSFVVQSPQLPSPRYGAAAVAYQGNLYVIGGNQAFNSGPVLAEVMMYPITADGTLAAGTATLSLLSPRFLAGAAAYNKHLYVTSGATTANEISTTTDVLVGTLNGAGNVTAWVKNPNSLPTLNGPYVRSPATAQNGYLYVFGWQYSAFGRLDPAFGTIGNADGGSQSH